eukprot:TRINITY_DN6192_c0_g1_i1.p1 TRINITY_DN6192_c0_g1~~TRINITY_DN6192_c0_g1_i1.p1  ORF type:complete len:214 (+),score=15.18 TRINITY_DN6192_c0_g1_i1:62-643(+)
MKGSNDYLSLSDCEVGSSRTDLADDKDEAPTSCGGHARRVTDAGTDSARTRFPRISGLKSSTTLPAKTASQASSEPKSSWYTKTNTYLSLSRSPVSEPDQVAFKSAECVSNPNLCRPASPLQSQSPPQSPPQTPKDQGESDHQAECGEEDAMNTIQVSNSDGLLVGTRTIPTSKLRKHRVRRTNVPGCYTQTM